MSTCKEKTQVFTEEVWNQQNFRIFDDMLHQDFRYHDPIRPDVKTKEDYQRFISDIQSRSPDTTYETLDIIAECQKVVILYSWSGTPVTDIAGAPLSGKKLEHKGVAIYYFEQDKVVKIWDIWDMYSILKQLGKIP
jgi:steroid delta-isomerase-like uncharacterized protein